MQLFIAVMTLLILISQIMTKVDFNSLEERVEKIEKRNYFQDVDSYMEEQVKEGKIKSFDDSKYRTNIKYNKDMEDEEMKEQLLETEIGKELKKDISKEEMDKIDDKFKEIMLLSPIGIEELPKNEEEIKKLQKEL